MPSKGRKASTSSISRSTTSRSPATPFREPETTATTGEVLNRMLLSDATARFPHLLSESPLCRILSGTETSSSNGHLAKIWLSKNFLGSASLISGSLVSVALVASGKKPLGIIPLYNFVEPNISHLGIDVGGSFLNEAGHYFAIAYVLSSNKVQENEVKLSWSLYCTMGFPTIGQSLLISPIGDFSRCHNERCRNSTRHLHLHICKNLNVDLIPITSHDSLLSNNSSTKLASISSGNGNAESPQMPPFHSKLPSIVNTPLHLKNSNGSSLSINSSSCFDMARLNHILANEEIKAFYVKIAPIWLNGRYLLFGNIVSVSLCGMVLFSSVEGADDLTSFSKHDPIFETKNNMMLDEAERATSLDRKYTVLYVKAKTKISPFVPPYTARESSIERLFPGENAAECISGKEPNDIPRLGGLSKEFTALEEIIKLSLAHKDPSPRLTGVLLHGPPGTGKTTLASYCVHKAGAELILIRGQYYYQSEQSLHEIFDKARKSTPVVVFIDDLDAIAQAKRPGSDRRMAESLSKLMDDIKKSYGILVIAATNQPDNIDPSLRQHGRFSKEIEIGMPSADQRLDILHTLLNQIDHSLSNTDMELLALETHGFVYADLAALCNEASNTALFRYYSNTNAVNNDRQGPNIQGNGEVPFYDDLNSLSSFVSQLAVPPGSDWPDSAQNLFESNTQYCSYDSYGEGKKVLLKVFAEDFEVAKKKVRPIAMREVMLNIPNVSWEDVGGQREVKKQLIEAIEWPIKYPDAFKRSGVQPPRGLLMVGPPGCSKTLMARAVAWEAKLNFLAVKGPEIFCKLVGESEKAVRSIFEKARARSPAIIFFDEMDSLARTRGIENDGTSVGDRVLSQLLVEMDGLQQRENVIVIAATNRPDMMDPALLRPGRFDRILVVEPPNESDREDIFRIHAGTCSPDVDLKELARLTSGYTGADIKLLCSDAGLAALDECLAECDAGLAALDENFENLQIFMEHFRIGIQSMCPTEVDFYQKIAERYRRSVGYGYS